jgi:hypothetical protein
VQPARGADAGIDGRKTISRLNDGTEWSKAEDILALFHHPLDIEEDDERTQRAAAAAVRLSLALDGLEMLRAFLTSLKGK